MSNQQSQWSVRLSKCSKKLHGIEGNLQLLTKTWKQTLEHDSNEIEQKEIADAAKNSKKRLEDIETQWKRKNEELKQVEKDLDYQRKVLRELKDQSELMKQKAIQGEIYEASGPTLARQISNKVRIQKELQELSDELAAKKIQLEQINHKLQQSQSTEPQHLRNENLFKPSSSSQKDQELEQEQKLHDLQELYKNKEKQLRKRVTFFYLPEIWKGKMLFTIKLNTICLQLRSYRETIDALKQLQLERACQLHESELKDQLANRDAQIRFLIEHFGQAKQQEPLRKEKDINLPDNETSMLSLPSMRSRKPALEKLTNKLEDGSTSHRKDKVSKQSASQKDSNQFISFPSTQQHKLTIGLFIEEVLTDTTSSLDNSFSVQYVSSSDGVKSSKKKPNASRSPKDISLADMIKEDVWSKKMKYKHKQHEKTQRYVYFHNIVVFLRSNDLLSFCRKQELNDSADENDRRYEELAKIYT
ncbi:hypothetical protein RFI_20858 [Reticulomyxa filosa]|uniref:Uncharacterized protein n=1 Tax=Reticulomyxa filosa TaxID=46433 RepID=X6MTP8_RETFI|nr:hypothetical protein RFI_20858 [Reticulomyxa filosa]|eukprot:ETO16480.1 hypothetical protein RFI_20858 [Reticulomyxa filosa]